MDNGVSAKELKKLVNFPPEQSISSTQFSESENQPANFIFLCVIPQFTKIIEAKDLAHCWFFIKLFLNKKLIFFRAQKKLI